MKTIEQAKNEAAKELKFKDWEEAFAWYVKLDIVNNEVAGKGLLGSQLIDRAIRIYADSCVSAKIEEFPASDIPEFDKLVSDFREGNIDYCTLCDGLWNKGYAAGKSDFKQEVRDKLPNGEAMTEYSEEYHCTTWPETNAFRDGLAFMKDQVKELLK